MKSRLMFSALALGLTMQWTGGAALAGDMKVKITPEIASVDVMHNGKKVTIKRNQDGKNTVNPAFAKTSRNCPPFCIQPSVLAPGVETIGEVEILDYLKRMSDGDDSILVIDSRTPDWVKRGTIPGSVNLPWTKLNPAKGADPISIGEIMASQFGAKSLEQVFHDFADRNRVGALGRIERGPRNIDRAGNRALLHPVRGARIDHQDRIVAVAHTHEVIDDFRLAERFDARREYDRLDTERRTGARGLGERGIHHRLVVLVAHDLDRLAAVLDRGVHHVGRNTYRLVRGDGAAGPDQCHGQRQRFD